jgi:hypothetical protein
MHFTQELIESNKKLETALNNKKELPHWPVIIEPGKYHLVDKIAEVLRDVYRNGMASHTRPRDEDDDTEGWDIYIEATAQAIFHIVEGEA